jgi:hypothetical protein
MFSRKNLGFLLLFLLLMLAQAVLRLPWLGLLAGLFALSLAEKAWRTPFVALPGWLIGISGFAFLGTMLFYVASVPTWLLAACGLIALSPLIARKDIQFRLSTKPLMAIIPALPSLILFGITAAALFAYPVTDAVRSPFDVVPLATLILLGLQLAWSIFLALRGFSLNAQSLAAISFFLSFSAFLRIAYPIGFGFDPFIHRATMSYIAEFSTITPKPFYYIGNYMLELGMTELFHLPRKFVNDWLVPTLGISVLLITLRTYLQASKQKLGLLAVFFLPLSALIVSTPQSLSYFLSAGSFFLGAAHLIQKGVAARNGSMLLALFSAVVHPLAGIPALLFAFYLFIKEWQWVHFPYATLSALSMPIIFLAQSALLGNDITLTFAPSTLSDLLPSFTRQYTPFLDIVTLFAPLLSILTIAIALIGLSTWHKRTAAWTLATLPAILFANYVFIRVFLSFDFLIEYESSQFADRLLILSLLALIPLAAVGLHATLERWKASPHRRIALVSLLVLSVMSAAYATLPRNDAALRGRGLNVSLTDIETVYAIDELGRSNDYAVLAGQMTSVAALQELGFATYFNESIFYYPIPTGGPLYDIYLEFVEGSPTLETVQKAKDLTGAGEIFVVVNDYWWDANATSEKSKLIADDWFAIGDNSVNYIFRFTGESNQEVE